ncbi:hypothetical protein SI65_06844 [Aspergillus cristatus]|uniref:Uncharacterized protein n=1 Tax=Aspergillus cristatus TaxID=573508 RepID=A0A1E3BCE1_ASPCR|nr:hypothetical protein SI65_06844 [Aspergillus cristatus]
METINRALDSASHVIWGETHPQHQQHGEEPLSGVQGQGKATDPYDAGNRDVQPGAPSTTSPTATTPASQKKSVQDPTGRSSEPLSPAVSEDVDSQAGGYPRPGTGNGFTSAGLASGVPEKPGLDADPALNGVDPKTQSQSQGMANATGVPEGEQRTVMENNPPGLNSRTSMGPGLGAMGEPSTAVAGGTAGGAAGAGAGIGGGAAAAGSTAGPGGSGSSTSEAAEQRASSDGASGGQAAEQRASSDSASGGQNAQYGKPNGNGGHQVSEEALKGPQAPPPREKYEFEKEMEGKPASKGAGGGGQSQPQGGKAQNGNGGHHHFKPMEKVKEKMGRATKAGTHK